MKKVSLALLAALATIALLATAVPSPAAPAEQVKTKVTIKFNDGGTYGDSFSGKVKSKVKKCKKKRKVTVKNVGSTKSDKKGNWRIDGAGDVLPGTYRAKVKKKTVGNIVCKKAKSKPVTVA